MGLITQQKYFKDSYKCLGKSCTSSMWVDIKTITYALWVRHIATFSSFASSLGFNSESLNEVGIFQKLQWKLVVNWENGDFVSWWMRSSHFLFPGLIHAPFWGNRVTVRDSPGPSIFSSFLPTPAQQTVFLVFPKLSCMQY